MFMFNPFNISVIQNILSWALSFYFKENTQIFTKYWGADIVLKWTEEKYTARYVVVGSEWVKEKQNHIMLL